MCATLANLCVNSAKPAFQAVAQHKNEVKKEKVFDY
jgi:hypothetical protein